jgi:hypothetical protein
VHDKEWQAMEKIVEDLKKIIPFKETIEVGDVVLIATKEPQMIVYGIVSEINRDMTKKDEWYHVHMNVLSVPPQRVIWTLRSEQMTGQEIFTMAGDPRFMKALDLGGPLTDDNDKKNKQAKAARSHLRLVK